MKNSLIINFKLLGDIVSTAHIAAELINRGDRVYYLVFSESLKAAKIIDGPEEIYTVDRKKIERLLKSEIFHDVYAVEAIYQELDPLNKLRWDNIINISNDPLGTRICSYLRQSQGACVKGVSFNSNHTINFSGTSSKVFNDFTTAHFNSPIHYQTLYRGIAFDDNLYPHNDPKQASVITNLAIQKKVTQKLDSIAAGREKIAIQLTSSSKKKMLPFVTASDLLQMIKNDPQYRPIIITSGSIEENEMIARICEKVGSDIPVIESSFENLTNILSSLHFLVTPDTAIKHIADCLSIPCLEISLGESPCLKQGTINPSSGILSYRIDLRIAHQDRDRHLIEATDIKRAMDYLLGKTSPPDLAENFTLYRPMNDEMGVRYVAVAGDIDTAQEASRVIGRHYLAKIFDCSINIDNLYRGFEKLDTDEINSFIQKEKGEIAKAMKSLLAALRTLVNARECRSHFKSLIIHLDEIISVSEDDILASMPASLFKAVIENISNSKSQEETIAIIENELFSLKNNMQGLLKCLEDFMDFCKRKRSLSSRTIGSA